MTELGTIRMSTKDTNFHFHCDGLATDDAGTLLVLSAAGAQTAVKALVAVLQSKVTVNLYPDVTGFGYHYGLAKSDDGYTVHRQWLGCNSWQVLCLARQDGLMPKLSELALWQELRSERYTTPILRSWVPWLMQALEEQELLKRLKCFGCDSAVLSADTEALDTLVSEGVRNGSLTMPSTLAPAA